MKKIDTSIFKAYDIRGIYPDSINQDVAYLIGSAYSQLLKKESPSQTLNFLISGDMRLSTPTLKDALIRGILDQGCSVTDAGLLTTPTFYFAVAYYNFDGGIQVSASHNPKDYNGFKMVRSQAVPISGETGIQTIKNLVVAGKFTQAKNRGTLSTKSGITEEMVSVLSEGFDFSSIKPLKIVIDAANSVSALDLDALFKHLPCQLVRLNFQLDGSFPVHQADPLDEKNLKWVKEAVGQHRADLGIAPDGDGDRYFFIDEKGQVVRQEILRGIMAQIELEEHPGATVAYDIRPGKITADMIKAAGGKPLLTRVGHSLIKEQMIKNNAIFGGESSGHYFYRLPFGTFEAPVKLLLKFLRFISIQNRPLSQIIKPYQKYFHSGEINSKVKDPLKKIKQLKEKYHDGFVTDMDGVTFEFKDFWFNVRPSNTEPLLRLNLEAVSPKIMAQKRDEVLAFIRS